MKTLILLLLLSTSAYAYVSNEEATTVILGAASDEGYKEIYAIACALKNADTTDNAYERIADISSLPQELKDTALKAWKEAQSGQDVTLGATSWVNEDLNGGYMNRPNADGLSARRVEKKTTTVKIGRHTFQK